MAPSAHLICGDDEFLVAEAAQALVDRLVPPDARALSLEIVDGRCGNIDEAVAALRRCRESVATPGFLGEGKTTWLRDASFLLPRGSGRSAETEEDVEDDEGSGGQEGDAAGQGALKNLLAAFAADVKRGLPAGQSLVVTTTRIARNSVFYKAFATTGEVQDFGSGLKGWALRKAAAERLARLLEEAGLQLDAGAQEAFLARAGTDTRLLASEVEKLRAYVGRSGKATAADVAAVVSLGRESEAWDLMDAFGRRSAAALAAEARRLLDESRSPIYVCAMLESRVRELLLVRESLDRGWLRLKPGGRNAEPDWSGLPDSLSAAGGKKDMRKLSPWQIEKLARQAETWRLPELRLARYWLVELRERLVSSTAPGGVLLEAALLQCVASPSQRRAAKPAT
jgi:DNA polymerase III delta subunit